MRNEFKERDLFGNLFYVVWNYGKCINVCIIFVK